MSAVRQILDAIHALPRGEQRMILRELTAELGSANGSRPPAPANDRGSALDRLGGLIGSLSAEDAKAMQEAIEDCERIDPSGW